MAHVAWGWSYFTCTEEVRAVTIAMATQILKKTKRILMFN